jgi:hypothetical protein
MGGSRARQLLAAAFLVGLLGAVIASVLPEWQKIDWEALSLDRGSLLISDGALVLARLFYVLSFSQTLAALDAPLPSRALQAPLWGTALANYVVPTKLASAAGLAVILQRRGIGLHTAAHAIVISSIVTLVVALAIGAPAVFGFALLRESRWLPVAVPLAGLSLVLALACLHPRVFAALLNPILVRLGRPELAATLRWLPFVRSVGWTFARVATRALAFAARALAPLPWSDFGVVLMTTGLAIGAGTLAFFAPAGLGVHEAIYLIGLEPLLGPTVALLLVVFRVLVSVVDLVCGGAIVGFFRSR